ncbi:MAG: glucokinase [Gammaproteobacteria bacterium]
MRFLAGDIGGTKALLEIFEHTPSGDLVIQRAEKASGSFPSFEALLVDFMQSQKIPVRAAAFSVAAPLREGRGRFTNLPWQMDEKIVAGAIGIPRLRLINDFVAAATGVPDLAPADLVWLNPVPLDPHGVRVVLGAGTGLGQGFATPEVGRSNFAAWPSEGGHADFAPRSEEEVEIWRWVRRVVEGRVGYERLVSGSGLSLLYAFYAAQHQGRPPEPSDLGTLTPAAISAASREGQDPVARQAVAKFLDLLGSVAGNAALHFLPTGGIYLAGGVIVHLASEVQGSPLLRSYADKGRLSDVVRRCPLALVLNPELELIGARRVAVQLGD